MTTRARELRASVTEAERVLWDRLRSKRLDGLRFRRQAPMFGYFADFYCPRARLVVEVDGSIHRDRSAYDERRDRRIASHGVRIVRVSNWSVMNEIDRVLAVIRQAVA